LVCSSSAAAVRSNSISRPPCNDGYEDDDGCPDEDNDADTVLDVADRCPTEAGVVDNGGCPDTDRDGDTVVDRLDNCPDEPGTVKNFGCKDKQLVVFKGGTIELLDIVYFKTNKAIIEKRSFKLLRNVATVINAPPRDQEGHRRGPHRHPGRRRLQQGPVAAAGRRGGRTWASDRGATSDTQ
jgi:hypothetical protein